MEVIQRAATHALQVDIPMASTTASTRDPSVGEDCQKAGLDTTVGVDARSLDL
jgi:hypothetical protein